MIRPHIKRRLMRAAGKIHDGRLRDDEAFVALRLELARARKKFPINELLLAALTEELGELAQSLLQEGNGRHTYKEAIQVACVALRIAVEGAPEFDNLPARIRRK